MEEKMFLKDYFELYQKLLFDECVLEQMVQMKEIVLQTKTNGNKMIFAGNGGSAAIASHAAVDFTKQAGVRSINFNESDLITCFANDYGYDKWIVKAIEFYGDTGDVVVLFGSSGKSPNIVNAAEFAKDNGFTLVTFSGFEEDNPLKSMGEINFWVESKAYNIIENIHQIWILAICDLIIGKAEYPA